MNNFDMQKVMAMLSKMDKKDLEQGLAKATEILKSKEMEDNMRKNNANDCNGINNNENNYNNYNGNNNYNKCNGFYKGRR